MGHANDEIMWPECQKEDCRDEREARVAFFGGELGLARHVVGLDLERQGLGALVPALAGQHDRRLVPGDTLALTPTQACRALGIDKHALATLVAEGTVRTVPWRGTYRGATRGRRWRVPRSEVERLAAQGIPEPGTRGRRRPARQPSSAKQDAEALRRLDVQRDL